MAMMNLDETISAFRCCTQVPPTCSKCPLTEMCKWNLSKDRCKNEVKLSVNHWLKAQEPRVMAYEELSTFDGAFIIESSALHPLEWVFFFDTDAKSDAVWVQGFDGERCIVYREDYGIYVRCWTSRPTDEQREAVKWE